jgi:Fe-S-cluster containining protein
MDYQTVTEEEFRAEVAKMVANGSTLVRAIYDLIDKLSAEAYTGKDIKLACGQGCSACCYNLVSSTQIEWKEIKTHLEKNYPSKNFLRVIKERVSAWKRYLHTVGHSSDPVKLGDDWYGKPCVFLAADGSCRIYPVRPYVCRTYTSSVRCTLQDATHVVRDRWRWERWANHMILDEEARQRGWTKEQVGVTALLEWLSYDPVKIKH